jgi:predicted small lipoprotein YifL
MRLALVAAIVSCSIAACGQKGNLYLRDSPPAGVKPAKAEPYKPVPYPKESADEAGAKK